MSTPLVNSLVTALLLATAGITATSSVRATGIAAAPTHDGIVKVMSSYSFDETVARLKQDIARKGITFFMAVEQSKLAAEAGIALRPQVLLVFGNPALGAQFLTSNPHGGARLAGAPPRRRGRGRSRLGGLHRLRIHRAPPPGRGPRRRLRHGLAGHRLDHIGCRREIAPLLLAGLQ